MALLKMAPPFEPQRVVLPVSPNGRALKIDIDKAVVQQYLQSSGLANASILLGDFLENFWTYVAINTHQHPSDVVLGTVTCAEPPRDTRSRFQSSALPLFHLGHARRRPVGAGAAQELRRPIEERLGKRNPVALARMTYPELAQMTSEALGGVEVTFTSLETKGIPMVDDLYACVSEFGLYVDTPVPNPDLVALGFQFSTMEEFMKSSDPKEVISVQLTTDGFNI
ncbi:hypothetical protein B0H10DRAFT_2220213 [Mycena sp. CBHHK59/15]|nr:hypothetical protein B0H10DRAFT_2220213 [Mycena sp. CBHHK59/15]